MINRCTGVWQEFWTEGHKHGQIKISHVAFMCDLFAVACWHLLLCAAGLCDIRGYCVRVCRIHRRVIARLRLGFVCVQQERFGAQQMVSTNGSSWQGHVWGQGEEAASLREMQREPKLVMA